MFYFRFPTLNRWIQVQSNLHRVSESALASKAGTEQKKERSCLKRLREPEPETKTSGSFMAETLSTGVESNYLISKEESEVTDACFDQNACISFDDDEGPYETAVEKYSIFFLNRQIPFIILLILKVSHIPCGNILSYKTRELSLARFPIPLLYLLNIPVNYS